MLKRISIIITLILATLVYGTAPALADVGPDGRVTWIWHGVDWPPTIKGWTYNPVDGSFVFLTTSHQEPAIHPGDMAVHYSSDPEFTKPNSIAWLRYVYDHGGGLTIPFSFIYRWPPEYHPQDKDKIYEARCNVTPEIAKLLADNGITLDQLYAGKPLDAQPLQDPHTLFHDEYMNPKLAAPAPAPAKTKTPAPAPAPAKQGKVSTQAQIESKDQTKVEAPTGASGSGQSPALPQPADTKTSADRWNNPASEAHKLYDLYQIALEQKQESPQENPAENAKQQTGRTTLIIIASLVAAVILGCLAWILVRRRRHA